MNMAHAITLTVELDENDDRLMNAYDDVMIYNRETDEDYERVFNALADAVRRELIALADKEEFDE